MTSRIHEYSKREGFSQMPNVIDSLHLSHCAYRLYGHLKTVISEFEGKTCYESAETMAKACDMGVASVSRAKKELVEKGLIIIRDIPSGRGNPSHDIELVDIWPLNDEYLKRKRESRKVLTEPLSDSKPSTPDVYPTTPETFYPSPVDVYPSTLDVINNKNLITVTEEHTETSVSVVSKPYSRDLLKAIEKASQYQVKMPDKYKLLAQLVCYFWQVTPPAPKHIGYWVKGCAELQEACAEFGYEVLLELSKPQPNRTSLWVASPNSLVRHAQAKVGQMRRESHSAIQELEVDEYEKRQTPLGKVEY